MLRRLTILLYTIGVGLLIFVAEKWIRALQRPDEVHPVVAVDEPFNFEALTDSDGFTLYGSATERAPGALLAIFTMP
ncbi:MAG: hypothetical protein OXU68_07685, partial [Bacteroidota bacterium]|nr:hypothetical protein [Bacteroidota bacterium]